MKLERKNQVILELTVSLTALIIFVVGIVKIFVWANNMMTRRQVEYNQQSPDAAGPNTQNPGGTSYEVVVVDESRNEYRLDIFGDYAR